ncbi:RNA polymerase factor sigma-54 [Haliovirga abyssi]|uniref:RNA polymerase sigma-54 factor n=1 Tax=Haliovirga abyssi TaxID=2996794 RepID=A0AAU9D1N2_9FUSO|nr:RNA polymerase factor sigma-54 [Haliovirga abyssi]BDU49879.1 RNA polymerase sigma-54 factor [Haliovirga abyssi]
MKLLQTQKLEQKLMMTQDMRLSLEILQMSVLEIEELISNEEQENPLIEVENVEELDIDAENSDNEFEIEELYRDDDKYEEIKHSNERDKINIIEKTYSLEETVMDKYYSEIQSISNEEIKKNGYYILENLDDKGYYRSKINDEIDVIRKKIMHIDDFGIGAKNFEEFLIFQIENDFKFENSELLKEMIERNFQEIFRKKYKELKKIYNIEDLILEKIYKELEKYRPYPTFGLFWNNSNENIIIPEVVVEKENGVYEVYLKDKMFPDIKLNNEYYKELSKDKSAIQFLKEKAMKVRNLKRSIEQRNFTLYRVSKAIVDNQEIFFEKGMKYLKPMTLSEIGNELNLHESTISRVVNNKYMSTPRGVFELKFFFSGKVKTENREDVSIIGVQERIKEILEFEDKKKPFNDGEISQVLSQEGINVSSRTVKNYRENLGILPGYLRKGL